MCGHGSNQVEVLKEGGEGVADERKITGVSFIEDV